MGNNATRTTIARQVAVASVAFVVFLLAFDASADTVVMKNGSRFEGRVLKETPEKIVLQTQFGAMEFQRDKVKEVIKRAIPKPPPPKPEGSPKKPESEARPEKAKPVALPRLGSRGRVRVVQRVQATSKNYVMNIKDAVAILSKDDPNRRVEVSFLPFKLSEEDIAFLRKAQGNEVASLVGRKSSPDEKYWEDRCPYVFVNIKFEEGKERQRDHLSECQVCFSQFIYPDEKAVETWKDRRARQAVPKFELFMDGKEGVLDMSFSGRCSSTRRTPPPAETHGYTWSLNVTCRVFVK